MNNPRRILQTLDRHLTAPAELTIFGRAALALGYADSPATFATTQDVDAILPLSWLAAADANLDFWQAQQRTNAELEPQGLYITHLFREVEIILTPDWLAHRVLLPLDLDAGELAEEELYPSDAAWSGIYDRLHTRKPDEIERRLALAFAHGDGFAE
ncbi:MAG TPA: hypothetical protein VNO52_05380 [Methylomirabilota bacterium]|nr:hypothetical protein [Methylomirabilota bacterium]